jgi:hypothetical protein
MNPVTDRSRRGSVCTYQHQQNLTFINHPPTAGSDFPWLLGARGGQLPSYNLITSVPLTESWRRGWDSNPRMEVLQTSPLGHLGTAPNFVL